MTLRWPEPRDLLRLAAWDPRPARVRRSIVHLIPSVAWGGAERLACTMHRLARDGGWRSRIDAPAIASIERGVYEDAGEALPRGPYAEGSLRAWADAARARIARERPSVVHVHLAYPDRYGLARIIARGRPLVASLQLLPKPDSGPWPPDEVFRQRCDRALAAYARLPTRSTLVAPSRLDYARLLAWIPRGRLAYVANAPPLRRVHARPESSARAGDDPWGASQDIVRVLSAGRLHPQKGYDRALRALADARVRVLPWRWLIAGDGEARAALEAQARDLGLEDRVIVRTDVTADQLYRRADLLLAPSRFEGMPLVPPEAIDAGVAVLASSIAPHREQLGSVPECLLDDESEDRWPPTLARYLADADARARLRARQRALRPEDPHAAFFRDYEAIYTALARES